MGQNKLGIPVCLIKYEDLINNPLKQFEKMFEFIKKVNSEKNIKLDIERVKKTINETSFKKLQSLENKIGFKEHNENKRSSKFFNKGRMNDWKNNLPKDIEENLIQNFKSEMLELGYLK